MTKNPKTIEGNLFVDDRGYVSCVNDFNFGGIKRFYVVENHQQGFVRAWHGHKKESKYVYVVSGSALICAVKLKDLEELVQIVPEEITVHKQILSSKIPKIFYIPAGYANGFMTLEPNTKIMFFSTATLEESKKDDIRFPHDRLEIANLKLWEVIPR